MNPEQIAQLSSWADERDALLAELVPLRQEKVNLLKDNGDFGELNRKLAEHISRKKGQIDLMGDMEEERALLVSQELAALAVRKSEALAEAEAAELRAENAKADEREALVRLAQLGTAITAITKHVEKVPAIIDSMGQSMKENSQAIIKEASNFRKEDKLR